MLVICFCLLRAGLDKEGMRNACEFVFAFAGIKTGCNKKKGTKVPVSFVFALLRDRLR